MCSCSSEGGAVDLFQVDTAVLAEMRADTAELFEMDAEDVDLNDDDVAGAICCNSEICKAKHKCSTSKNDMY